MKKWSFVCVISPLPAFIFSLPVSLYLCSLSMTRIMAEDVRLIWVTKAKVVFLLQGNDAISRQQVSKALALLFSCFIFQLMKVFQH